MNTNDETLYLQAMQEVESDNRQEGLWAKALTLEKGNAEQAKYRYVQLRVEQLQLASDIRLNSHLQSVSPNLIPRKEPIKINSSDLQENKISLFKHNSSTNPIVYSPTNLTSYTVIALVLLAAMTAIAVISDTMQLNMLENIGTITIETAEANDKRVYIVDWTHIVISAIAWIILLVWKYRINKNCHGFGAKGMRFTPGWAVGWDFVPVMMLFRPYQVMQEIWKVSTEPATWQNQRGGRLIKWWWFFYLVGTFFAQTFFRTNMRSMLSEQTIEQLENSTNMSIIVNCAMLGGCPRMPLVRCSG